MPNKSDRSTWYPLDNAGLLYSAIQRERYSAVYRFSAVMVKKVDPEALQRAVDLTLPQLRRPPAQGRLLALLRAKPQPRPLRSARYGKPLPACAPERGQ